MAGPGIGPQITSSPNEYSKADPSSPARREGGGLMQEWSDWLAKPENSSGMMAAGLALLQPRAPGQTSVGQVGQAIGQGFQTRDDLIKEKQAQANAAAELAIRQSAVGVDAERNRLTEAALPSQIDLAQAQAEHYRKSGAEGSMTAYQKESLARQLQNDLDKSMLDPEVPEDAARIAETQARINWLRGGGGTATPGLGAAVAAPSSGAGGGGTAPSMPPAMLATGHKDTDVDYNIKNGTWRDRRTGEFFDAKGNPVPAPAGK